MTRVVIDPSVFVSALIDLAIVGYIGWSNRDRLHSQLGDLPPAQFEALGDALRSPFGLAPRGPDPTPVTVK